VLAKPWRRAPDLAGRGAQLNRHTGHHHVAALWIFHLDAHPNGTHLLVVQPALGRIERAARDAPPIQQVQPLVSIAFPECLLHFAARPADILWPDEVLGPSAEPRVLEHVSDAESVQKRRLELWAESA
jgi:hypothetical protein